MNSRVSCQSETIASFTRIPPATVEKPLVMTECNSDGVRFLMYGLMTSGASARPRKTFPAAIIDSHAVVPTVT